MIRKYHRDRQCNADRNSSRLLSRLTVYEDAKRDAMMMKPAVDELRFARDERGFLPSAIRRVFNDYRDERWISIRRY